MGFKSFAKKYAPTSRANLQRPADKIFGVDNAKKASKEQGELTDKALAEYDQFTDPRYKDTQRAITDRLSSGTAADIDEEAFQSNVVDPAVEEYNQKTIPGVNQNFRGNFYSMSRKNAQVGASNDLYNDLSAARQQEQSDANTRQTSALTALQQAAQNRANILTGAAANVQALPSGMQMLNDTAATIKNARGAYAAYQSGKVAPSGGGGSGGGGGYSGSSPYGY